MVIFDQQFVEIPPPFFLDFAGYGMGAHFSDYDFRFSTWLGQRDLLPILVLKMACAIGAGGEAVLFFREWDGSV